LEKVRNKEVQINFTVCTAY